MFLANYGAAGCVLSGRVPPCASGGRPIGRPPPSRYGSSSLSLLLLRRSGIALSDNRRLVLLAGDEDRPGQRGQRDGGDEHVDEGRRSSAHPYGPQEGLHVGDEDDARDRRTQDA